MNAFNIKVQILGITSMANVAISSPKTVAEIFRLAGQDIGGGNYTYKLDGKPVNASDVVESGSILIAAAQIKGN